MPVTFANILRVPFESPVEDGSGIITRPWQTFFRLLKELVDPMGSEKIATLVNNQAGAADISGMILDSSQVSHGVIEYLIQRVTTGGGATELITGGMFHLVYKPTTAAWAIQAIGTAGPSTSGITFSVTAAGQVQYTSTNITGTASISRIVFRMRTLGGKNSQYSTQGPR